MFNKKPSPIHVGAWVLARHNFQHSRYDQDAECHAGRVQYVTSSGLYAVRFTFGTRWLKQGDLELVPEAEARKVLRNECEALDLAELPAMTMPRRLGE